jgi:SAM-dependent methyltransferase
MFRKEAQWLADCLQAIDDPSPVLNIGSSSAGFREKVQPWIDQILFAPLRERGVRVIHNDIKEGRGIDSQANLLTDEGFAELKALKPRTILLCNLLEHVHDPKGMVQRAFQLLEPGGRLIVSVPRSYPHHRDPFDTMFRPTPQEVAALEPDARLVQAEILPTEYHWHEVFRNPRKLQRKRALWLFVPYKVTFAVLERPASAA